MEPLEKGESDAFEPEKEYPGIGRLAFFFGYSVCSSSIGLIIRGSEANRAMTVGLVLLLIAFALVYSRLRNVGKKKLVAVLLGLVALVPLLNLWPLLSCFAAQEGYEDTKELDDIGKVINALVFIVFLGVVLLIVVSLLGIYNR